MISFRPQPNLMICLPLDINGSSTKQDRLPWCTSALQDLAESVEDFRARRLRRAVVIAPERGLPLKSWALLKLTGLREKDLTPRLAKLVEELVSSSVPSRST